MPLKIVRQDITKIECDAVVNPTNQMMTPGGGTDLAIHTVAGEKLLEICKKLGGCEVGKAKVTPGFNLPCKFVIHTVGPVWIDGNHGEKELIVSCYNECLTLAKKKRCKSVAIPLISSGTHGFPKDKVLKIALDTVGSFLFENEMTVYIVVYDKKSYEISATLFEDIKSFIDDNCIFDEDGISYNDRYIRKRYVPSSHLPMPACDFDADGVIDNVVEQTEYTVCSAIPQKIYGSASGSKRAETTCQKEKSLDEMLKEMDKSFSEMLFYYIDLKGITDVQCYKKANVDKKTFSKIKCKKDYKPSKQTALSFAIALELDLEETSRLLQTVGMSLSNSNKFDIIVKYFIINGKYNIYEINETLFEFDQVLLGSV